MKKMRKQRRKFTSELAKRFELHPNQISNWKHEFLEKSSSIFDKKNTRSTEEDVDLEQLYSKIGKLEMERDFLKKNLMKLNLLK